MFGSASAISSGIFRVGMWFGPQRQISASFRHMYIAEAIVDSGGVGGFWWRSHRGAGHRARHPTMETIAHATP
jgi:hypothetical protein